MEFVEIFKALGDENRIRILNILKEGELCVCEIESILGITQSNASRHLNKLKSLKMISGEKKAQWVYYAIDREFIIENELLYYYLRNKFDESDLCVEDIEKLKRYKSGSFTCEELREDKEKVIKYLEGNYECKK